MAAVLILLGSLGVVLVKNPVRATLLLIVSFLPTALLYILLHAPFVGILQVLVYAGAIMMLFTFVIMMVNPSPHAGEQASAAMAGTEGGFASDRRSGFITFLVLAAVGAVLIPMVYSAASQVSADGVVREGFGDLASIGRLLFTDPANNPLTVSFELLSFLILVGIIAALNFSRRKVMGVEQIQKVERSGLDAPKAPLSEGEG